MSSLSPAYSGRTQYSLCPASARRGMEEKPLSFVLPINNTLATIRMHCMCNSTWCTPRSRHTVVHLILLFLACPRRILECFFIQSFLFSPFVRVFISEYQTLVASESLTALSIIRNIASQAENASSTTLVFGTLAHWRTFIEFILVEPEDSCCCCSYNTVLPPPPFSTLINGTGRAGELRKQPNISPSPPPPGNCI